MQSLLAIIQSRNLLPQDICPDRATELCARGDRFQRDGKLNQALDAYLKAACIFERLKRRGNFAKCLCLTGNCAEKLGRNKLAAECFKLEVQFGGEPDRKIIALNRAGQNFVMIKDLQNAGPCFAKVPRYLIDATELAIAHARAARVFNEGGKTSAAAWHFELAAEWNTDPKFVVINLTQAMSCRAQLGEKDKTQELYDRAKEVLLENNLGSEQLRILRETAEKYCPYVLDRPEGVIPIPAPVVTAANSALVILPRRSPIGLFAKATLSAVGAEIKGILMSPAMQNSFARMTQTGMFPQ